MVVEVALKKDLEIVLQVHKPDGGQGLLEGAQLAVALQDARGGQGEEQGEAVHCGGRTWLIGSCLDHFGLSWIVVDYFGSSWITSHLAAGLEPALRRC